MTWQILIFPVRFLFTQDVIDCIFCVLYMYIVSQQNMLPNFCPYSRQILTDFPNFFNGTLCGRFAITRLLNIQPHLKCGLYFILKGWNVLRFENWIMKYEFWSGKSEIESTWRSVWQGLNLSGGQKQRVSIARASYSDDRGRLYFIYFFEGDFIFWLFQFTVCYICNYNVISKILLRQRIHI